MKHGAEVTCTACGQRNRIPFAKVGAQGTCGRCHTALPPPASPVAVERLEALQQAIGESPIPVLVDFWAAWCGPCRAVAPVIAALAERHAGRWLVVKADTEPDPRLGAAFGIRSIPTLAVFHEGRELGREAGARPLGAVEAMVERLVAGAAR